MGLLLLLVLLLLWLLSHLAGGGRCGRGGYEVHCVCKNEMDELRLVGLGHRGMPKPERGERQAMKSVRRAVGDCDIILLLKVAIASLVHGKEANALSNEDEMRSVHRLRSSEDWLTAQKTSPLFLPE